MIANYPVSSGVPPRLHDEDIGLSKPPLTTDSAVSELTMAFHVALSSQLGEILQVVSPGPTAPA
jgi:hypothetical protein